MIAIVYNVIKIKDKEKLRMTKYVLFVDHNTGFGKDNKKIPLEAINLLVALHESTRICEREENLFRAFLYKRVSENEYELIMKTYDGKFFCTDSSPLHLVRRAFKSNGKTVESFEWKNNY